MTTLISEVVEKRAEIAPSQFLEVSLIDPSPYQARENFEEDELRSLAESIKIKLLNDIIVRPRDDRYELIAGERRLRAVRDILGYSHIAARIIDCSDKEAAEFGAIENLQRVDLRISAQARQIQILIKEGVAEENIIKLVGSKKRMEDLLRVAELPKSVQQMLDERQIKMTHVSVLANLAGADNQVRAAEMVPAGKLTKNQLQARTQHLPQRTSTTQVHTVAVTSFLTPEDLNRLIIKLRHDLPHAPDFRVTDERSRNILKNNIGMLVEKLLDLKKKLE